MDRNAAGGFSLSPSEGERAGERGPSLLPPKCVAALWPHKIAQLREFGSGDNRSNGLLSPALSSKEEREKPWRRLLLQR